jgi:hypothetical protein
MADNDQNKSKVAFLPWHAINAFMLEDFQLEVLKEVLSGYDALSSDQRRTLNNHIKRGVKIPGFRNSISAPVSLKAKNAGEYFEKNADFVASVLDAWFTIHQTLGDMVYDLLTGKNWQLLPLEANRKRLPGFLPQWPEEEQFSYLVDEFRNQFPDQGNYSDNQISLMCVWLSGRLPFELVEKDTVDDSPPSEEE